MPVVAIRPTLFSVSVSGTGDSAEGLDCDLIRADECSYSSLDSGPTQNADFLHPVTPTKA
jgi:hypothetical protein